MTEETKVEVKKSDPQIVKEVVEMVKNSEMGLLVGPMMLKMMLPKIKGEDPKTYYSTISTIRSHVEMLRKAAQEYDELLTSQ